MRERDENIWFERKAGKFSASLFTMFIHYEPQEKEARREKRGEKIGRRSC